MDGNQFENGGFRKGWRLVYINPNPQEWTQAFLPPLIVAVLIFSGVVWTGPYLACKQAHCHARERRSLKWPEGKESGEEVLRFAARFRARGYAPWAYAPTWACSQARPYSATRSCWNSHSKERSRWILRLRKQSSRPKSRSALGLVLFQWNCFVLYKKVYLFPAFLRRFNRLFRSKETEYDHTERRNKNMVFMNWNNTQFYLQTVNYPY